MLVLSRHRDESIMIGDDIVVTIVDIRGDKVRLGIDAPQDIPVHRQEVYDAIQRENRKAEPSPAVSDARHRQMSDCSTARRASELTARRPRLKDAALAAFFFARPLPCRFSWLFPVTATNQSSRTTPRLVTRAKSSDCLKCSG